MSREWPSTPPEDCPFEPSRVLRGVSFTGRHAEYTAADTWYPSWGDDDILYSPWTDGAAGAWLSSSIGPLAGTGHARILGSDPLALTVEPLGTRWGSPEPYGGRYPCGSLMHDGIWYYGSYCLDESARGLNWDILGPFVGFRVSTDRGASWEDPPHTPSAPIFGESGKRNAKVRFGAPHFVDFGRNMEHSPDGKAYLVGHGATRPYANLAWIAGDAVFACRVTPSPETINDPSAYEFFAGHDSSGEPVWSNDLADSVPLLAWNDRIGHATATWVPGLERYLMCVTDGWPTISTMNSMILEAPALTGPWRLVSFLERFGPQAYFLNFPSRFLAGDGRTAWLCYSANFTDRGWSDRLPKTGLPPDPEGSSYAMCLQEVELLPGPEAV
jgi:hypothetical protein